MGTAKLQSANTNMADDDEIDILGDFSLDSCLPKIDRGVPSCSEFLQCDYTVHPQWLLDSSATACWLDSPPNNVDNVQRNNSELKRPASVESDDNPPILGTSSKWTAAERRLLQRGLNTFGHDINRISKLIATKSEEEVQLLIETEYGVLLDTSSVAAICSDAIVDGDGTTIPNVAQEEIIADNEIPSSIEEVMYKVNTAIPTISTMCRKPQMFKSILKNSSNRVSKSNKSLLKPNIIFDIAKKRKTDVFNTGGIDRDVLYYEDDFFVDGSESVIESTNVRKLPISKSSNRNISSDTQGGNTKAANRRRRKTTSTDKFDGLPKYKSKFNISLTINKKKYGAEKTQAEKVIINKVNIDDTVPKMQIVTGSGQALPLSEGEQVIKIEKSANSEAESDIEIDIESDDEATPKLKCNNVSLENALVEKILETGDESINQHRKVELARKRKKKIHLDGDGGYTIRHTEAGDVYEIANEPRPQRGPRKETIRLTYCKSFNSNKPAPYHIRMLVSSLMLMDLHAHTSRAEVMGLLGGEYQPQNSTLVICAYEPCDSAASSDTHCDMCPVSQSQASESLLGAGHGVVGWHHSHPRFPPQPSAQDAASQGQLQRSTRAPFVGLITSQHWPPGRTATQYKCLRVEIEDIEEYESETSPVAYQFSVKLHSDIDLNSLPELLRRMRQLVMRESSSNNNMFNNMAQDVCPDTRMTYLEKFISSARQHLKSSGYAEEDIVFHATIKGMRDIFR